jgi:hypothetical protein
MPSVDGSPRSKGKWTGASRCQSSRQYCLDCSSSNCFRYSKVYGCFGSVYTSLSFKSAVGSLADRIGSSEYEEIESDSSSSARSSELRGESEGSLSPLES